MATLKDLLSKESDMDSEAAFEAGRAANKGLADCDAKSVRLLEDITATEIGIRKATSDDKAKALATKLRALEDERIINNIRRKGFAEDLAKAEAEQRKIGLAGVVKGVKRNTKAWVDNTEELVHRLQGVMRCYIKEYVLHRKIELSIPIQANDAMLIVGNGFYHALATELYRLCPVHPLGRTEHPPFPGSKFPAYGTSDPAKLETLVNLVKQAAEYIIRSVEQSAPPAPPSAAAPQPEPQHVNANEVEPVHQKLNVAV